MEIGKKILELRKQKNLSQEQLANELNVSRQTVSKWENDIILPDLDNVVQLSRFFEISVDDLLGNSTTKNIEDTEKLSMNNKQIKSSKGMNLLLIASIIGVVSCLIVLGSMGLSYILNPITDATLIYVTTTLSEKGIFITCLVLLVVCLLVMLSVIFKKIFDKRSKKSK